MKENAMGKEVVDAAVKVHPKQLFTYLKLRRLKLGFLLNFGSSPMEKGIERIVTGLEEETLGGLAAWREQGLRSDARQPTPVGHQACIRTSPARRGAMQPMPLLRR